MWLKENREQKIINMLNSEIGCQYLSLKITELSRWGDNKLFLAPSKFDFLKMVLKKLPRKSH